ncbi:MAG: hypothetical protein ACW99A_05060 [Candidatus Kariarchaeaceae archaeon]|jgi:hypothetical protein
MFDQTLVSLDSDQFLPDILISLSFVLIHLILIQLASELINHKLHVSTRIWKTHGILTFVGLFVLKYLMFVDVISEDYFTLKFLIGEPLRIVAGIAMIHSTKSKLIIKSQRTSFIKNGWIFTGLILVISGIIQFTVYSIDVMYELFNISGNSPAPISLAESLSLLSVLILALFVSTIAVFYPEAMLLSHTQIIKAAKIYDILSETEEVDDELLSRLLFRSEAPEALIDYIKSLPEDVINKLEKSDLNNDTNSDA